MDKRELLSMLTCHGASGTGGGGRPNLTAADVAGMMAPLTSFQSALLRAKYCNEQDSKHAAWAEWFMLIMDQGWKGKRGRFNALSRVTLDEYLSTNRCSTCNGIGSNFQAAKWTPCKVCGGSGMDHQRYSQRSIATALGRNGSLREPWISRLAWCRLELNRVETEGLNRMRV